MNIFQAIRENNIGSVTKFLDQGVNVNSVEAGLFNLTPLMIASINGNVEIAELLLDRGAAVNTRSHTGSTALMLASTHGHTEIVRLLLSKGADSKDIIVPVILENNNNISEAIKEIKKNWPIDMQILALKELGLYYKLDMEDLNHLKEYLGLPIYNDTGEVINYQARAGKRRRKTNKKLKNKRRKTNKRRKNKIKIFI